ncbi:MAG TPA: penicillin-binding transpeptidase domain-containing protein [Acidimicrobiales bacterium]|nr:penicillin-binding transpeptidase domain-containing protein [Acidimicrobiales bacterium]
MSRRRRLVIVIAVVVVAVVGVVTVWKMTTSGGTSATRREADAFLDAWTRGDTIAMSVHLDTPPPDLAATVGALTHAAPGTTLTLHTTVVHETTSTTAVASYHARADVAGFGPFEWDGQLPLTKSNGQWRVHWDPSDLFPGLAVGQRLTVAEKWPTRAPILGAGGDPLVSDQPAVSVGLEPDHITNLEDVKTTLSSLLSVDPATVDRALAAPGVQPSFFVPIITLPTNTYNQLRPRLAPVPGIVFQRTHSRFAISDTFAMHVLGRTGEITAEQLTKLGPPYAVGDTVGLSGLELVYESRLAGRPSGDLEIVDKTGTVVRPLQHFQGTDPQPVQTTLDAATQTAAEQALDGVSQPAALVAVDARTGQLRAVVSRPLDQPFDRALDGAYPPGSTFKVVTAAALLVNGDSPSTPAECPPTITLGGKQFRNFEGEAPGTIELHRAFAISCNTAFLGLAAQLPHDAMSRAASTFGFDVPYQLPLPTTGGDFPPPADDAERAAATIGQGRVTASPLQLATVAAAADTGQWRPPTLVLQPTDPTARPSTAPSLAPGVVDALHTMMTEVVTSGTGRAAAVPGQDIAGKTGTAEFGNANPPSTHAWFIGYRGDLAFAVLVEGGGVGGETAAPIANRFLAALPP